MREMHRNRDRIELQLDNRQIVSFVIGSLVVLGVVFALGVMVGKQLAVDSAPLAAAPTDPLAEIDAREKALAAAADASTPSAEPAAPKQEEPLTFAQELTKPKPVDPLIEPTRASAKEKAEPKRAEPAPEPKREEPVKVAAAEPEPEQPKGRGGLAAAFDKVAAKPAGGGAFALQAASLPNRGDADKMAAKLSGKGYSTYVVEADIPGKGTFYRVKVGSFASRDEANQALAEFKNKVGMDAIVTNAR